MLVADRVTQRQFRKRIDELEMAQGDLFERFVRALAVLDAIITSAAERHAKDPLSDALMVQEVRNLQESLPIREAYPTQESLRRYLTELASDSEPVIRAYLRTSKDARALWERHGARYQRRSAE